MKQTQRTQQPMHIKNINKTLRLIQVSSWLAATLAVSSVAYGEVQALVGATVHPVSSAPIENAVVLIEDGRVTALGSDVEIPAGARQVDLAGKHLYPGFIHPNSVLGLTEVSSVRGTRDYSEIGDLNSDLRAAVAFHADSQLLPPAMSGGILTAHVVPRGGIFKGTSALLKLEGWNFEDMSIDSQAGMHLEFPTVLPPSRSFGTPPTPEEVKKKKDKALATINEALDAAAAYGKAKDAADSGQGPRVDHDAKLEALLPVLSNKTKLFIYAEERNQIEAALDWAAERELTNIVLVAGEDVAYLAERLAEEKVSVVLDGVLESNPRNWEPYDQIYTAANRLHEAGVKFCIGDGGGGFDAAHVRNLPFHAAMAAAHGLPKEVALRSITLSVAEILGVAEQLGSIEQGKQATLIATTGDPLEILTRIERAWIAGVELDLTADRQKQLFRKYNERPRPLPQMEAPGG